MKSGYAYGVQSEAKAKAYLLQKGYRFLAENYRIRTGEIDLIFWDRETLVFVEVKARHGDRFGSPFEAVDYHKQNRIRQAAESFILANRLFDRAVRFDVVGVTGEVIEHITDAF